MNPELPGQTPSVQTSKPSAFRLFKREPGGRDLDPSAPGYKERPYYFRFSFRGKSYVRCLETADASMAQGRARRKFAEIKEAAIQGHYDRLDRTKLRAVSPATVDDLVEAYKTCPVDAEERARTQNLLALRQLLRVTYDLQPEAELALPISQVSAAVSRRWFELASKKSMAATNQADKTSYKRSANSRFVQAKSVFAPKALATYRELDIYHPNMEGFVSSGETFKFSKLPATSFNPPPDTVIAETLAAWEKLEDRNTFLAVGFELAFGLRIGELGQAKFNWLTSREGYPVLDSVIGGSVDVKNNTAIIQVRALDPWFTILDARIRTKGWNTGPEHYILNGTLTDRTDNTFRAVSAWLRNLKWNTKKTNHELRKYAGSQVAMKYGIYEAQCWLRHSTVKVTESHYSGYVKRFKPANLDTIPARWATLNSTVQLRLLNFTAN